MFDKFLNLFLKLSGFVFTLKQKMLQGKSKFKIFCCAIVLIFAELALALLSLPLYFIVSPKKLQERGFIFPVAEKGGQDEVIRSYTIRRKISVTTTMTAATFFFFKLLLIFVTSVYLLGGQILIASTESWTFDTAGNYTYDSEKIEVTGGVAQLKGTGIPIGTITDAVLDSLEFDIDDGCCPDIINIFGSVYAIAYQGESADGYLKTVTIGTDGQIVDTVIDTLEFDIGFGNTPDIVHISGNVYAIAYSGGGTDGYLTTVTIETNGQIGDTVIDTLEYDTALGYAPHILNVSGNVYVICYEGDKEDGYLTTVTIETNGQIGDAIVDTYEFDVVQGCCPNIVYVSGNIYAVAYTADGNFGYLITVTIATDGQITDSIIDTLTFDSTQGLVPDIVHISGNVYAIAYAGELDGGYLKTVTIATDGQITDSIIDTLEFDPTQGLAPNLINISGDIYGISYTGEAGGGYLKTATIAADGQITDTIIDTLEFDSISGVTPDMIYISGDVFAVAYSGDGADGFLKTIEITTSISYIYATDIPTINPTISLNPAAVTSWDSFTETATKNGGEIYYQLSNDDGSIWQYWNGSIWTTAGASDYNTATVVNANIGDFSTAENKLMWKAFLESDGSQQVIIDQIDVGYTENDLPDVANLAGSQQASNGTVYVNYDLQDAESDLSSLVTYEYSLTGVFEGEELTMTASTTEENHDGISSLTSSPSGVNHDFVWDAFEDIGAVYDPSVYVRLRANDGIGNGDYAISSAFAVDYVVPVVSNVSAVQTEGTTNVVISYDLDDDTLDSLFVELDISEDSGSTWEVADDSVSGDVGAGISTSTSKAITWDAGTDFDEQAQADLQVRVRAKDKYQNQGVYVESADFALDTLNPATNVTADLQAQPNAGNTTALIGGSFTETNPDTNNFYLAINGGAYGDATAGDTNTATPSDQATAVGATLDGNDYISKVKIAHTDDFGQAVDNENLSPAVAYKYVKPYTPQSPTLADPATTQLNLTINPHASETSGLEYAIYETSQVKFVQSNGTLGDTAVWQVLGIGSGQWGNSTAVSGEVNVNGLTSPVANYIFQVKSRNTSDGAHAASSESAYSATAQITNTAPSISLGVIEQTTDGTQYVTINYTGTDGQGDICSLATYEYSQNDSDWDTITEKTGVDSDGTAGLTFLSDGTEHDLMWDSGTDLSGVEDDSVYIRLKPNDSLTDGAMASSGVFEIDNVAPVVSDVSASQNAGARTVAFTYTLADANNSNVEIDISDDGGETWEVTNSSVSGDVGAGVTSGSKIITWDAGADFDNEYQTDLRVRIRALDTFGNQGSYTQSSDFTGDTNDPVVSNVTASQDSSAKTFTFNYDVSEDAGNVTIGLEISSNGGSTWVVPVTTAAGDIGAGVSAGSKTITWNAGTDYNGYEEQDMQIRVTATDSFTNAGSNTSANFNLDTLAPRVTSVDASQTAGTTNVSITYTLADQNNSLVEIDISEDSGGTWFINDTAVSGDIGAGISAGSKTITWDAGTDFNNQTQSDIRVQVRAKDTYENQSANVESGDFAIDTLDPATNVAADLQSQPNAGDTTALIGGSFTETNPDTNIFYLAINGGAYGDAIAGDTNTASPANQATAVGATLDGNDYISKVKITHTDDFGQAVDNENLSPAAEYKYVKPYTPQAPSVFNPAVGTVDVLINLHASETSGLEYAIYETTQAQYVQANGTLGGSAVWQTLGTGGGQWGEISEISGRIKANGLVNDSYTYDFKVKSRNTSDGAHAASSESALSAGASSENQAPSINIDSVSQITDGNKYVTINYTGTDLESESSNLITVEYSTNNSDWDTMTEKGGVGSDGTTGLAFDDEGTSHDFMWDVGTDLDNTEDSDVYVRLQANDGTSDGNIETSDPFTVDTKNPVISSVTGTQTINSNNVVFGYTLTDLSNGTVEIDISEDSGGTWFINDTAVSGDIGAGVTPGSGKLITWDAGTDFDGQEQSDLRIQARALDAYGNQGDYAQSSDFALDTKDAVVTNVSASQDSGASTVTITYDLADANNASVEIDISEDSGGEWEVSDASVSGDVGEDVTPGNGKSITWDAGADFSGESQSDIQVRVRAIDAYSNASGNVESSDFTLDTLAPVVSNVSAVQTLGARNVVISYDLSDISSVSVEIDISEDSGETWEVANDSVTGDIGAGVTPGNGKTITWDAGTDFDDESQSDIRVRVRALDPFTNSSGDIESSDFVVDTLNPATNVAADLQSQPDAGNTTALIGGSFTETNPDTNNFYVAINDGAYGDATAGATNTATPSDQATAVGATLDGNDYISKVKIAHTDDYAQTVDNENLSPAAAYKYVKPYTPQAPTLNNPQNTLVDIFINENISETSGLEYAIYESSTGNYVQAGGTLGVSDAWQTIDVWGTKTVTGLTSPVAQYSFQVKSRNTSDAANTASSESDLSTSGAITNTAPSISIDGVAQQTSGANYVLINYTGTDTQNDTNSLTSYEYSRDNDDNWNTMTEKTGVGDGTSNLIFTSSGENFTFAWDSGTDLPNIEDSTVYIRLQSSDTIASSNLAASSAFEVDNAGPVISGIAVSQTPSTKNIIFEYDLTDNAGAGNTVEIDISEDSGGAWGVTDTSVTGDIGAGVTAGAARSITWDAGTDFDNEEQSDMQVRIKATDSYGNEGSFTASIDFTIDTFGPVVSNVSATQSAGVSDVVVTYDLTDGSPSGHFIEFAVSEDSGSTWEVATTTYSGDMGAGQTTGSKTFIWAAGTDFDGEEQSDMRIRVRAKDYYGSYGAFAQSADFALDTTNPVISNLSVAQTLGTNNIIFDYDLTDISASNLTVEIDISNAGGSTWTVTDTSSTGDVGSGLSTGAGKSITWDAGTDFGDDEQSDMRVRIRATDNFGNISSYFESADFEVDTSAPLGLSSLSKFSSTDTTITLNWSSGIVDANFNHYELWHGLVSTDVDSRIGTAIKWDNTDDVDLVDISTVATVITGLSITDSYYVKIWAIDDYSNASTIANIDIYEPEPEPEPEPTPGGVVFISPDIAPPSRPVLFQVTTPTDLTEIVIAGLAEPRSRVDLYDNGVFVERLEAVADINGKFSQEFEFTEGEHILTINAVDFANNISQSSDPMDFAVDLVPPETPRIIAPGNNEIITNTTPQISGVAEPFIQVEIVVDGINTFSLFAGENGVWRFILPSSFALDVGQHEFVIRAIDATGKTSSPISLILNVEVIPVIPVVPVEPEVVVPSIPVPEEIVTETTEAVELPGMPVPKITNELEVAEDIIKISGTALPNQYVVVYMHSDQALVYRAQTDEDGYWEINHSQELVELSTGEHSVFAVTYDPVAKVKSRPSLVGLFTIEKNFWVMIYQLFNLQTTIITLLILLLTMMWLYKIRKKMQGYV